MQLDIKRSGCNVKGHYSLKSQISLFSDHLFGVGQKCATTGNSRILFAQFAYQSTVRIKMVALNSITNIYLVYLTFSYPTITSSLKINVTYKWLCKTSRA